MVTQWIDTCCNLTHPDFQQRERHIIERAVAVGVAHMIVPASSVADSKQTLSLADEHDEVYATVGVHPHLAREWDEHSYATLKGMVGHKKLVAIGESGLDYCRHYSPAQQQRIAFEQQIQLAIDSQLPLLMHQRDAHDDFVAVLRPWRAKLTGAVLHCFTAQQRELFDCLDLDLHIGITGWFCDERRGRHLRALIKDIPMNRLMLETDAPYLRPRHLKKARRGEASNEPALLPAIAKEVADSLHLPLDQLAHATTMTARHFYGLDSVAADG